MIWDCLSFLGGCVVKRCERLYKDSLYPSESEGAEIEVGTVSMLG